MPVKRRLSKQIDGRVTPSTIAAYARAMELRKRAPASEETIEAEKVVDRALQIRLWQISVFDVYEFKHPGDADWERSMQLRRQLDQALAAAREARRRARQASSPPRPEQPPKPEPSTPAA